MGRLSPEYVAYLGSPAWRATRKAALARAGDRCQFEVPDPAGAMSLPRCDKTKGLEVHHRTYARLGRELPEDLEVLCWPHHMVEHVMQRRCGVCGRPVLVWYDLAEQWLAAELAGLRLDPATSPRADLPSKTQLVDSLAAQRPYCESCSAIVR